MAEEQEDEPTRLFLVASYFVLFIGGGMLALFGAFLLPTSVSSAYATPAPTSGPGGASHVLAAGSGGGLGQLLSLGLLIAVVGNPALSIAGLWMAGSRLAATVPLIGWLAVVLPLGSVTSEGNNVLPGNLRSAAFLLLGILGFIVVAILAKPSRGITSFGGQSLLTAGGPLPAGRPVGSGPRPAPRASTKSAPKKSSGGRTAPKGGRRR